jgi:hypothetical protein
MPPEASTQVGDTNTDMDVDQVAAELTSRRQAREEPAPKDDDPVETEEVDPKALEAEALGEDPPEGDPPEDPEQDALDDDETDDAPIDAEPGAEEDLKFEYLDEVAEAAGMSLDDFQDSIKIRTRVDGEDSEVTLSRLVKGHQLESSFTRKNQEWIDTQKKESEKIEVTRNELQDHFNRATVAFNLAQQQLTSEFQSIDWNALQASDSQQWLLKRQQFGERQTLLKQAVEHSSGQIREAQEAQKVRLETERTEHLEEQHVRLMEAIPEWQTNETKRDTEAAEVGRELKSFGYTDDEISELTDHRLILLARKALGQAGPSKAKLDLAKKKVTEVTRLVKSRAKKSTSGAVNKAAQAATAKAKRTGTVDDVAEALIARSQARSKSATRRRGRRAP